MNRVNNCAVNTEEILKVLFKDGYETFYHSRKTPYRTGHSSCDFFGHNQLGGEITNVEDCMFSTEHDYMICAIILDVVDKNAPPMSDVVDLHFHYRLPIEFNLYIGDQPQFRGELPVVGMNMENKIYSYGAFFPYGIGIPRKQNIYAFASEPDFRSYAMEELMGRDADFQLRVLAEKIK